MARSLTEQECQEFLAEPHIGVLSVASDDDRPPLTVPIWYHYAPGGQISFFTGSMGQIARKTRLIRKAGVLSLCVQREEFPYKYVTVEGTVVTIDESPTEAQVLSIVRRYLPEDQARGFATAEVTRTDAKLIVFTVHPERWISFDFSE